MSPFVGSNIIAGAAGQGGSGFSIQRSLRFNSEDSSYLSRTPSSAGNRRTFTHSFWFKMSELDAHNPIFAGNTASNFNAGFQINFQSNGTFQVTGTAPSFNVSTTQVFRDPSAWYHIVVSTDTTQSTASDRIKFYINGVQVDNFATTTYPSQNADLNWNGAFENRIGGLGYTSSVDLDGYLADVHFIDGQALAPTDFGEYDDNNVWQAKEYTHNSPTTSSFTLADNDFTWSGLRTGSANTPDNGALTNGSLNYGDTFWGNSNANGSYLDIDMTGATDGGTYSIRYWNAAEAGGQTITATCKQIDSSGNDISGTSSSQTWTQGQKWNTYIQTIASNCDRIRLIFSGNSSTNGWGIGEVEVNFIPSHTNDFYLSFSDNSSNSALGYDAAVDAPTLNPKGGMDVVTYTGNGSTQTISGLAFQPDLVWIKDRTQAFFHELQDTVRGAGNRLIPNDTAAESSANQTLTAFTSDGFTVNWISGVGRNTNESPDAYVAWCWKAGGAAVSNTDGSITSQVSASTDYGFSIVKYTGTSASSNTIGHSLGSEAKFIIVKSTSDADNWFCYHIGLDSTSPENYDILLNSTGARRDFVSWNDTAPTSSVFSVGNTGATNENGRDYIAYCWSEVAEFSKFGSYSGSGTSGKAITSLGFKPRWILIKNASVSQNWFLYDTERGPDSANNDVLRPNLSDAELQSSVNIDFDADGFTLNSNDAAVNASGNTYIYAAFADRPGNNWDVNNLVAEAPGLSTANQGFDVVTYTGNGSTQTISGLNFSPDLVWIKMRSTTGYSHKLVDQVRGATKSLVSNNSNAELTETSGLTAFTSDGFSLGSQDPYNRNNDTFVAWCWKAGGTAVSNTDGTITSQVSASTDYGFSICTYTGNGSGTANSDSGDSFGHGLSSAPKFILCKRRNSANGWPVYHASTALGALSLNGTNALDTGSYLFAQQHPSSSVVYLGNNPEINATGSTYVAYCWSEVAGFSKFGSYDGNSDNSNVTNRVIDCGFKPKYVLIKCTSTTGEEWMIYDSARNPTNPANLFLRADFDNAESSYQAREVSFVDNGFKFTGSNGQEPLNLNGRSYLFAAFADKPPGEIIDSLIDTPTNYDDGTNVGGNYATLNPLFGGPSLTNGNLDMSSSGWLSTFATIAYPKTGKWYYEFAPASADGLPGIADVTANLVGATGTYFTGAIVSYGYYGSSGSKNSGPTNVTSSYGASFGGGDVIGVAFDADAGTLTFYKNGASQGVAFSGLTGTYIPAVGTANSTAICNFGQRPFAYTPPTGYKSLCTTNLPDPTIADGSKYFDTIIASGTGASKTFTMPGGFGPDLVWAKQRNGATNHALFDVVRGATKRLVSNATQAEDTQANQLSAFTSDGFTYGSDLPNASGNAGVYWAWDAGSSNTTISAGSLNSSAYDQSQTWSGGTTSGSATLSGNGFDKMFNGQYGSAGQTQSSGNAILTFTSPISFNKDTGDTLELIYWETFYVYTSAGTVTLSGGNSANNSFRDVTSNLPSGSITITGIGVNVTRGMRINGKPLIDSGVSVTNVPAIASTVRANPSAGFSIVTATTPSSGTSTYGHNLNSAPEFLIVKIRDTTSNWYIYHSALGNTKSLKFTTDAAGTTANIWNNTSPTNSVFTLGTDWQGSNDFVAYCFAPVEGYSAFGSYTGNGSADGPFVYTGFKIAWLMVKRTNAANDWAIWDNTRNTFNETSQSLFANLNAAEDSGFYGIDILSNGFKLRHTGTKGNGSGSTYIYIAFAENPFKTARAR